MIRTLAGFAPLLLLASAAGAQPGAPASDPFGPPQPTLEERRLARWIGPELVRFRSDAEFRRYLRDLDAAGRGAPEMLPPTPMPAPMAPPSGASSPAPASPAPALAAAGSAPANPAITNVQEAGVDEGDIVKQVGRFLIVLQDGRLFSADTDAPGGGLALADRVNVYASPDDDTWYDEMLVFGDRVVVTGYSYEEEASQFSVFRVAADGRLAHLGTFFLSSNDYFDEDNYATRLVGDRLVIYTPIHLGALDVDEEWEWPAVRRWRREEARETPRRGRPIVDARSIYRPVADWQDPVIHTVSICRLGTLDPAREDPGCESRGFIGPADQQMYVTPTDAWLWTTSAEDDWNVNAQPCRPGFVPAPADAGRAWLFRVPLGHGRIRAAAVRGEPIDQLSMAVIGGRFHALTRWRPVSCDFTGPIPLAFATLPREAFGGTVREAAPASYTMVPALDAQGVENRFTDTHLVYGGRTGWSSFPPEDEPPVPGRIVALPVADPSAARVLPLPHSVVRAERVGSDVIVTGYRSGEGLDLSILDLSGAPRIASTLRLDGRYESEGRSHAFNAAIGADGSGLIGLPTVPRIQESGRWVWRSGASDISYLSLDAAGRLAPAGALVRGPPEAVRGYACEVSCVDWYGNSRPIFTGGRVFALIGTELVEGRVEDGSVRELRRLDLTQTPGAR